MAIERCIILSLFRNFSNKQTITSLAMNLGISRVGVWKALKKLQKKDYIVLEPIGLGKTSTQIITINWENIIVEKVISLYLTEEALRYRRWQVNFNELEREVKFSILYGSIIHSSQQANDIDILNIAKNSKFIKIQKTLNNIQKTLDKKVHDVNLTEFEFKNELHKLNKAFIDAINKGVVLFGQEKFVKFMKKVHQNE